MTILNSTSYDISRNHAFCSCVRETGHKSARLCRASGADVCVTTALREEKGQEGYIIPGLSDPGSVYLGRLTFWISCILDQLTSAVIAASLLSGSRHTTCHLPPPLTRNLILTPYPFCQPRPREKSLSRRPSPTYSPPLL